MSETLKINRKTTPPTLTIRTVSTREVRLTPLRNLYDAQDRVKARGSHYFDPDTARYFRAKYHGSRGLSDGFDLDDDRAMDMLRKTLGRASVRKMGDHDLDFWIDCSSMEHSDGAGYREAI